MLSDEERELLHLAQSGDKQPFSQLVEPYRYELQVHSYRLLGSAMDAEDAIQEAFLRAWTKLETFKRDGSLRAWLYKIATNVSLNMLNKNKRKFEFEAEASPSPHWLEPLPDEWLQMMDEAPSLESQFITKEKVHLAFITVLQILPPRQRAVLVFRDVLGWQAKEVADILDLTVSSVNSLLHRARTHISAQQQIPTVTLQGGDVTPLLERYIQAWETANIDDFVALLVEDATYSMPPLDVWVQGKMPICHLLQTNILHEASIKPFRCKLVQANNQPGVAIYQWNQEKQVFQALAIQVLTPNTSGTHIENVVSFLNVETFRLFGLPRTYQAH